MRSDGQQLKPIRSILIFKYDFLADTPNMIIFGKGTHRPLYRCYI